MPDSFLPRNETIETNMKHTIRITIAALALAFVAACADKPQPPVTPAHHGEHGYKPHGK
jgi:hypothetical protein